MYLYLNVGYNFLFFHSGFLILLENGVNLERISENNSHLVFFQNYNAAHQFVDVFNNIFDFNRAYLKI